jgi:hypothetical protein
VAVNNAEMKSKIKDWKWRAAAQLSDYHNTHLARAATLHAEHHAFLKQRLYHQVQSISRQLTSTRCERCLL